MLWPVVKALLGHYRRYPLQLILVWLGLTLGVSLLVGVTAINNYARQGYEQGNKFLTYSLPYQIRTTRLSQPLSASLYEDIRRQGFQCTPFETYDFTTSNGQNVSLVGISSSMLASKFPHSLLADLSMAQSISIPYQVLVGYDFSVLEGLQNRDMIRAINGQMIGTAVVDQQGFVHGTRLLTNLQLVNQLRKTEAISVIACSEMSQDKISALRARIGNKFTLTRVHRSELESLTKAFHMNLNAIGMLAFLVGLFIFYQAMSLTFVQRQHLVGLLRQVGVSRVALTKALAVELAALVLICWICGNVFGLLIAHYLIPTVSGSLGMFYSETTLSDSWSWLWSLIILLLAGLGALLACLWPLLRLLRTQPIRLTTRLSLVRLAGTEFTLQAILAIILSIVALVAYQMPHSSMVGFVIVTVMLTAIGLITPFIIWTVFNALSFRLRWVKLRWFFADAAASMSYRGVATMAFMIALAANVGLETMVGSFRVTTDRWLDQRLAADIYTYTNPAQYQNVESWLYQQPEVTSIWRRWEKIISTELGPLQVVSSGDSEGELYGLTIKVAVPDFWFYLHHSHGLMISESMSLKLNIHPGDVLDFPNSMGKHWQVVGVYYDYGNPHHQMLISENSWTRLFGQQGDVVLGAVLKQDSYIAPLKGKLQKLFNLDEERIFDNNSVHALVMRMFDRTFAIADVLSNIILLIALFGVFFATLAGESARQRHLTLLRCLGVSGKELIVLGSLQLLVFGLISLVIALPLGMAAAQLLIDIVIKNTFGWSIELHALSTEYFYISGWALLALMVSGAIPVIRLVRNTPMKSLRDAL